MSVTTLSQDATSDEILSRLSADGAVIVADVIDRTTVQQMTDETMPYIDNTPMGGDAFTGRRTQRTGALIARSPTCRRLVLDPTVIETARRFLAPAVKFYRFCRAPNGGKRSRVSGYARMASKVGLNRLTMSQNTSAVISAS